MSKSETTACWAVECEWYEGTYTEPMVTLACDSEAQAIDNWLVGEYVLGYVATIYRPEIATHG